MRIMPARDAQYRRGTIMGLTAAEAFMLICFILLLLISLWQRQTLDKLRDANQQLREARAFQESFTETQRLAAVTYKEELEQLGDNLKKLKTFDELLAEAGGEAQFRETLQTLRAVGDVSPIEVVDRVRLLDDNLIRQVAQATENLPEPTKRKLAELSSKKKLQAMIEVAHSSPEALQAAVERLNEFERLGVEPQEITTIQEELTSFKRVGLQPEQIRSLSAMATEVEGLAEEVTAFRSSGLTPEEAKQLAAAVDQLRNEDAQSGADIAAAIRKRAGTLITEMGGQILENGSVTFPENVLFDPGKSNLKPAFDKVLSRFCEPWLEVLRDFDVSLRNVQIEGHASSEWNDAAPSTAFINNLGLSQARAATVFQRCLDYVGDDELGVWARSRLAAVGYSSSRTVKTAAGAEDRERSRRVVFALDVKTADDLLIERIVKDAEPAGATDFIGPMIPKDLESVARQVSDIDAVRSKGWTMMTGEVVSVVDGDTIFVGTKKVRLHGLHAPELSDAAGQEAKAMLQEKITGRQASCWMSGETTFDRDVGVCFVDELDVATVIIANALGRDCPGFSAGRYAPLEVQVPYKTVMPLPAYCVE